VSRRAQENLVAGAILAVLVAVIVTSLGYGPRARMIPLPLAGFGIILIVAQIIWQNLRSTDELQVDLFEALTGRAESQADPDPGEDAPVRHSFWRGELAALGMVAALVGLTLLAGPIAAVCVFTGAYFVLSRHFAPVMGIVYSVSFTAVVYLLFVVALEVQLYHGLLQALVDWFG
jgi:hypothetical protein